MASLRKIHQSKKKFIYYLDFTLNGQRVRKSTGTDNRACAMTILDEVRGKLARGNYHLEDVVENNISIENFERMYLENSLAEKTYSTTRIEKFAFADLKAFFGKARSLRSISETSIREFKAWLMKPRKIGKNEVKIANATVNIKLRTLKAAFNWAMGGDRKYIGTNPFVGIAQLPVDHKTSRSLLPIELDKLFAQMRKDGDRGKIFGQYVSMLLLTGGRRNEVLDLKWQDIDQESGFVQFNKTKTGAGRGVPISSELKEVLQELWEESTDRRPQGRIFPYTGTHASHVFKMYAVDAGLPDSVHLHCLRHTAAFMMRDNNANILDIKDMLGHSSTSVTEQYSTARPEHLRPVANKLSIKRYSLEKKVASGELQLPEHKE